MPAIPAVYAHAPERKERQKPESGGAKDQTEMAKIEMVCFVVFDKGVVEHEGESAVDE
jgi:hypothetical protein